MNGELLALLIQIVPELGAQLEKLRVKGKVKSEDLNSILMAQLISIHKDAFRRIEVGLIRQGERLDEMKRAMEALQRGIDRIESNH